MLPHQVPSERQRSLTIPHSNCIQCGNYLSAIFQQSLIGWSNTVNAKLGECFLICLDLASNTGGLRALPEHEINVQISRAQGACSFDGRCVIALQVRPGHRIAEYLCAL